MNHGPVHGLTRRLVNRTLANGVRQVINPAAVAYMVLLDFGLATYVANRLTQAYSRGDLAAFNKLLASALTFSVTVCGAAAVLALQTVWALRQACSERSTARPASTPAK